MALLLHAVPAPRVGSRAPARQALDRLAPSTPASADIAAAEAYVWHAAGHRLEAVSRVNRVSLDLLMGIDRQKEILLEKCEPEPIAPQVENRFMSAFIRAVKPSATAEAPKGCCAPTCCN